MVFRAQALPHFYLRYDIASMDAHMNRQWHPVIKMLHWLMAFLVFVQFALGWLAEGWHLSPAKLDLFVWHKSIGMLILALVLVRIVARLIYRSPGFPAELSAREAWLARVNQFLLYALMLSAPISGWIINSAANIPFRVFWSFNLPDITGPDKELASAAELWHLRLFILLALLVLVHAGAALNHHLRKHNNILRNMLPGRLQ